MSRTAHHPDAEDRTFDYGPLPKLRLVDTLELESCRCARRVKGNKRPAGSFCRKVLRRVRGVLYRSS